MVTDPARIASYIYEELKKEAPFLDYEALNSRVQEIAEEIADQSRWALDPIEIMEWFWEYYGDKVDDLVALKRNIESAWNEKMQELIDEILEELELHGWSREEFEHTYGMEESEIERVEEIFREEEEEASRNVRGKSGESSRQS